MASPMEAGVPATKCAIEKEVEFSGLYRSVSAAETEIEVAMRATPDAHGNRLTRAALVRALSAQKRVARTVAGLVGL
jgi:hypothetical protein